MKKLLTYLVAILVVIVGVWWLTSYPANAPSETSPTVSASPTAMLSPSATPRPTATVQPNITITSPKNNAIVESPVTVTGKARVFENQFTVAITDMNGKIIIQKEAVMSDAKDSGQFGNYSVTFDIPAGTPGTFKIISYSLSPKGDGSYEGYAEVTVKLKGLILQIN